MESSSPDAGFKDADERSVFEHQLTQLQEQLVAVMIENQSLQRQVEDLEEKVDKDKTLALLDYERHRAQLLEDKCAALEKQKQKRKYTDLLFQRLDPVQLEWMISETCLTRNLKAIRKVTH
nr:hypothetical protein BaRGS_025828 [Batillaria attramentaria]